MCLSLTHATYFLRAIMRFIIILIFIFDHVGIHSSNWQLYLNGAYILSIHTIYESGSREENDRAISTARLNTSLCLHLPPIYVVIFYGSQGKTHLVGGFALRCFQCLSQPDIATQRCDWRHNWYTSGQSNPVLSY